MDLLSIKPNVVSYGVSNKHFLFYGEPSTRKTSVAALFPNSLILATEIGYKQIPNVMALDIDSWATFSKVIKELKKDEVKARFKTIVIDTISILSDMCINYVCNINSIKGLDELVYGKAYTQYKREFNNAIDTISQMGYSIVFIAHEDLQKDKDGNIIGVEPKIDKRPKEKIIALTDFIFYLKKENIDGRDTVMAYSKLPNITTKTRIRNLAPSFEFTYDNIVNEIEKALNGYNDIYNTTPVQESEIVKEVKQEIDFNELRQSVVDLATELLNNEAYKDNAAELISGAMKGVRISEAPESYRQILIDLRTALDNLR